MVLEFEVQQGLGLKAQVFVITSTTWRPTEAPRVVQTR